MSCWLHQRGFVGLSDSNVNSQETSWQLSWMIPKWLALSHMAELSGYTPQWLWSFSRLTFACITIAIKYLMTRSDKEDLPTFWRGRNACFIGDCRSHLLYFKSTNRRAKLTCLRGHWWQDRTGSVLPWQLPCFGCESEPFKDAFGSL